MTEHRRRVVIAYKTLPTYRVDFYNSLRNSLAAVGIELRLVYGQPTDREAMRRDTTDIQWAEPATNRFFRIGSRNLVWQPIVHRARQADLVIVEQASKLLVNYVLLLLQRVGFAKVAFWGHGANLQGHTADRRGEAVKRLVSRYPHWWFAYTAGSRDRVIGLGYPEERITVVQNAIDTRSLRAQRAAVSTEDVLEFREEHDLGDGPVCAFVGGLYAEKRLPFLLDAADIIHRRQPEFRLIVIGDGPERALIEEASVTRPYVRYLGGLFGAEKVKALATASLMLMPGLVGLVVLDSFALEIPLVTTAVDYHSPEIEYLEDGVNGVLVRQHGDPAAYAETIVRVLHDEAVIASLRAGCRRAAEIYTNEEMVRRFTEGITRAIWGTNVAPTNLLPPNRA
jgi:glycosyltransferase involved in cell wall biosynthesis